MKKHSVLWWVMSALFIIGGIGMIPSSGILAGIFSILLGIALCPIVPLRGFKKAAVSIALLIMAAVSMPESPNDSSVMTANITETAIASEITAEAETEASVETAADTKTATETETLAETEPTALSETDTDELQPEQELTFSVLDVGQGLSVLIESNDHYMLFDGGDRNASSYVVSYLKNQGVTELDYLIASHYDSDHINGVIGALNAFTVGTVIGPDYEHDSATYDSFINNVDAIGKEVVHPSLGYQFELGSAVITVLAPSVIGDDSNNNSIAIKITNGDNSFIITGDAEYESEANMVSSGIDLDTDVLVVGHHGSATATSWDFIEATTPEYAIISCGEGNSYGHPDADVMEKLISIDADVFRTDKQGEIIAQSDGNDITWNVEPCEDYSSGDGDLGTQPAESGLADDSSAAIGTVGNVQATETQPVESTNVAETSSEPTTQAVQKEATVWLSQTGSKYHSIPDCGNMNPNMARQVTLDYAQSHGYEACKRCH